MLGVFGFKVVILFFRFVYLLFVRIISFGIVDRVKYWGFILGNLRVFYFIGFWVGAGVYLCGRAGYRVEGIFSFF